MGMPRSELTKPALGADFRLAVTNSFTGLRRDHGADVAAVEDGSARLPAKSCWRSRMPTEPTVGGNQDANRDRLAPQLSWADARSSQARSASNSLAGSPPHRQRFSATAR
jgi:hypothetical protein